MREQLIFEHSRAGRSAEAQYPLDAPAASVPETNPTNAPWPVARFQRSPWVRKRRSKVEQDSSPG